jgi:hypothetical protein
MFQRMHSQHGQQTTPFNHKVVQPLYIP